MQRTLQPAINKIERRIEDGTCDVGLGRDTIKLLNHFYTWQDEPPAPRVWITVEQTHMYAKIFLDWTLGSLTLSVEVALNDSDRRITIDSPFGRSDHCYIEDDEDVVEFILGALDV